MQTTLSGVFLSRVLSQVLSVGEERGVWISRLLMSF